jgi:hypothetical protein
MAAIGGDILEVAYNHPTLGSGILFPKAGEDSTFDNGGFRNSDDANMIDGGGAAIYQMNRVRWSFECTVANDNNTREDLEKVVALAESTEETTWTVSHISGAVYKGKGKPVGDLQGNGNAATFTLKVSGSGKMAKI